MNIYMRVCLVCMKVAVCMDVFDLLTKDVELSQEEEDSAGVTGFVNRSMQAMLV